MTEIRFCHGALCDSYEKQANEQGFTLSNKAEFFDDVAFAYNLLRIHGYLTDNQADKVCRKIQMNLMKNILPLGDE